MGEEKMSVNEAGNGDKSHLLAGIDALLSSFISASEVVWHNPSSYRLRLHRYEHPHSYPIPCSNLLHASALQSP
jgi:hypothetical protein